MSAQSEDDLLRINPGELRNPVTLLLPSSTPDAIGDVSAPTVIATRWAKIDTVSGSDMYRLQQYVSDANRTVTMRYLPGVSATMTVTVPVPSINGIPQDDRNMEIIYIEDVLERHVKLNLFCKEVT